MIYIMYFRDYFLSLYTSVTKFESDILDINF